MLFFACLLIYWVTSLHLETLHDILRLPSFSGLKSVAEIYHSTADSA